MAKTKFLRRKWRAYSKLGKGRKSKQKWNKPKGRDNKMREKRKGYQPVVSIGYAKPKTERGKFNGKDIVEIKTLNDLKRINKNQIAKIVRIGKKKKIEIAKEAEKHKIEILNLNVKKFLKELNKKAKKNESK